MMRAILANVATVIILTIIGHFFPQFGLFVPIVILPLVFIMISTAIKSNIVKIIFIPFCFSVLIAKDYLFRIYGGGTHDDAGRGWIRLVYYITLIVSTIGLIVVNLSFNPGNDNIKFMLLRIIYVLGFFCLSLALYSAMYL